MWKYANRLKLTLLAAACFLASCMSSGPVTQYYSLFPAAEQNTDVVEIKNKSLAIGVGPVTIPEFMDNPGVVSKTNGQQVRVSGQNAWAGSLKTAMARVLTKNLSNYWKLDAVSAFPWDNRVRPDYQIRLDFINFSGVRGGDVELDVTWVLLNKKGDKKLLTKRQQLVRTTSTSSANDYISALNQLLNELSIEIARDVAAVFQP